MSRVRFRHVPALNLCWQAWWTAAGSLLSYDGLDASRALAFFNDEAVEQDEESLFLWMRAHPYDDLVVLDVTASQQLADQYLDFASHGFHVISANKLAGASEQQ